MAERNSQNAVPVEAGRLSEPAGEEYVPLVDIYEESDGTVVLAADVPGATDDSVDVRVEKGVLTIQADARIETPEGYTCTYQGFRGGRYFRAFALSDEVNREQIAASMSDGVLTVRMPRAQAAKTHRIEIKSE